MSKISFKKILSCGWTELMKWVFDPRMIILLSLCIFIYSFAVEPLKSNAAIMGKPLNVFEPFVAVLNSEMLLMIIPLGFITLISDFPKIDGSSMFFIFRIGKTNWLFGQMLKLLLIAVMYIAVIFATSVLGVLDNCFFGAEWSKVATRFAIELPNMSKNFGVLLLPENLYNQIPLRVAAVESMLFVFVYLFFLGMILLSFSISKRRAAGFIACGLTVVIGAALCSIKTQLMWVFPMSHSIIWLHFTEYLREPIFPVIYSGIYFGAIILIPFIFCIIAIRKFDCENLSEE